MESTVILQQNCKTSQSFGRENYFKINWQTQNTHPCTHVVPLVFLRSFLPIFVDTQIHSVPQDTRQPIFQHILCVYMAGKTLDASFTLSHFIFISFLPRRCSYYRNQMRTFRITSVKWVTPNNVCINFYLFIFKLDHYRKGWRQFGHRPAASLMGLFKTWVDTSVWGREGGRHDEPPGLALRALGLLLQTLAPARPHLHPPPHSGPINSAKTTPAGTSAPLSPGSVIPGVSSRAQGRRLTLVCQAHMLWDFFFLSPYEVPARSACSSSQFRDSTQGLDDVSRVSQLNKKSGQRWGSHGLWITPKQDHLVCAQQRPGKGHVDVDPAVIPLHELILKCD